jgi:hypothetical protein
MFNPSVKNCQVACSREKINDGLCDCLKTAINESGPHHGTEDFEKYLEVFCCELKLNRHEVYTNPALLETAWDIYKNIKKL